MPTISKLETSLVDFTTKQVSDFYGTSNGQHECRANVVLTTVELSDDGKVTYTFYCPGTSPSNGHFDLRLETSFIGSGVSPFSVAIPHGRRVTIQEALDGGHWPEGCRSLILHIDSVTQFMLLTSGLNSAFARTIWHWIAITTNHQHIQNFTTA